MHERILKSGGFVEIVGEIIHEGNLSGYECHIARERQNGLVTVATAEYALHRQLINLGLEPEEQDDERLFIVTKEDLENPDTIAQKLLSTDLEELAPYLVSLSEEVENQGQNN